jgi:hypothetical protein
MPGRLSPSERSGVGHRLHGLPFPKGPLQQTVVTRNPIPIIREWTPQAETTPRGEES